MQNGDMNMGSCITKLGIFVIAVMLVTLALAQKPESAPPSELPMFSAADLAAKVPAPKADDVKSADAIMLAIYDVISGPIGTRNWSRFRSLFLPQARFTKTAKAPDGSTIVVTTDVEGFIQRATQVFASEAFYERSIVNQSEKFGNITQVFSSYESRHAPAEKPFERGINSIQLLNDGTRWWVVSILWDAERPDNPLPAKFATN
jgi:hypothetical protein